MTTNAVATPAPADLLDPTMPALEVAGTDAAKALRTVGGAAVLGLLATDRPGPRSAGASALKALGLDAATVWATYEPGTTRGAVTVIPLAPGSAAKAVVLAAAGNGTAADLRYAAAALVRAARGSSGLVVVADWADPERTNAVAEGLLLGGYEQPRFSHRAPSPADQVPERVLLVGAAAPDAQVVRVAQVRCRATLVARNLTNVPSNIKSPAWLAEQAVRLGRRSGLEVTVWDEQRLAKEGFGGILAVGSGSATPPRFVRLDYVPKSRAGRRAPLVALVGKGITFDSGGLCVKPAASMPAMKTDMGGAAAVLATIAACRELDVPVRVTALLAIAENHIDGAAWRPGDVVTQWGGTTVEVVDTDAEGRIVLADALAYACAELDADVLVDVATLTGGATAALGRGLGAVLGDQPLVAALREAGERVGETLWELPLWQDYRSELDSPVADLRHLALNRAAFGAATILGGLFLQEFVAPRAGRTWAHVDIAGASGSTKRRGILAEGATGYAVRTLLQHLAGGVSA